MNTVFQIAPEVRIAKDMVFGWVALNKGRSIFLAYCEDEEWLMALLRAIPWAQSYDEVRLAITSRLTEVRAEIKRQEEARRAEELARLAQAAKRSKLQEEERRNAKERADALISLEESMRIWFGNFSPVRVYEAKNRDDGYVYCRVVPITGGYVLLDDRGVVKGEEKNLKDVAAHILRRWW